MALIKCVHCGHEISDTTKKCVHCGKRIKKIKEQAQIKTKELNKKVIKEKDNKVIELNNKPNSNRHHSIKPYKIILIIIAVIIVITSLSFLILKSYNDKFVTVEFKYEKFSKVIKIEKGDTIQSLEVEKKGYEFEGWYLNNKKYNFKKNIKSDITLKGKWLKIFKVEFNSDGGTSIESQEITKGNKITKPENPTKDGFDFVNWYIDDKEYDFNKEVTSNITVIAKWKEQEKIVDNSIKQNENSTNKNSNTNTFEKSDKCSVTTSVNNGNTKIFPTNGYYYINVGDYIAISYYSNAEVGTLTSLATSFTVNAPDILQQNFESSFYAKSSGTSTVTLNYSGCDNGSKSFTFIIG